MHSPADGHQAPNHASPSSGPAASGFHLMAKPSGPACNLDCSYCFYLEKEALFDTRGSRRMSDAVLDAYTRQTIAATPPDQPVLFAWQGGEPTLLGLDFYRKALALQRRYGEGRVIENSFQTNGTLIDEDWAHFLAEHHFLVGLSLDGPAQIHDRYRRYRSGAPSHAMVMAALERLQRHGANFNVLACVDAHSSRHPRMIYEFLKAQGVEFIQFTPVVERLAGALSTGAGLDLEGPGAVPDATLAPFTVPPLAWGQFLAEIFDLWRRSDVGRIFVMNFEWSLAALMGAPGVVCVHQQTCGRALIVEHDGDVYACDHFVYPDYRLGSILRGNLAAMIDSPRQHSFGNAKHETLPASCRTCRHLTLCWGGCPKHRFVTAPPRPPQADTNPRPPQADTDQNEQGLNYLCHGYSHYLDHVTPWLTMLATLIRQGRDPAEIMRMAQPHLR